MSVNTLPLFEDQSKTTPAFFLIVISPPETVCEYVNGLKAEFYLKYGSFSSRYSEPHITICSFWMLPERQEKVFSGLQSGLFDRNPFPVTLDGFDSFPGSNVIYINVEESDELELLKTYFIQKNRELRIEKKFIPPGILHLTIAKKLSPTVFELSKSDYLSRFYQSSFTVDRLKVLRYDFDKERYFSFGELKFGK